MKIDFKDVFSIENPDEYFCRVQSYHTSDPLSFMYVFVHPPNEPQKKFVILFNYVRYFAGPMTWAGANFKIAHYDDCATILKRIPGFQDYPDENQAKASGAISRNKHYKMYLTGSNKLEVKIIALSATILQSDEI